MRILLSREIQFDEESTVVIVVIFYPDVQFPLETTPLDLTIRVACVFARAKRNGSISRIDTPITRERLLKLPWLLHLDRIGQKFCGKVKLSHVSLAVMQ